ncbi:hypothetical protein [Azoarcus olearius]|nr:hypothetical protein [Azoarcus olearius]ANQ86643.1 hypothetical protein dqs_3626 [Azoarcus olearius]
MSENKTKLSRRHFLLSLGAGGAAGAAAVATVASGGAAPVVEQAVKEAATDKQAGASEHARNYYRTARI